MIDLYNVCADAAWASSAAAIRHPTAKMRANTAALLRKRLSRNAVLIDADIIYPGIAPPGVVATKSARLPKRSGELRKSFAPRRR
jgi:hypothetical protein